MSREHAAIKWLIGIIAFVVWVAVGRGLIFGGDATYSSVGQQWAFGILDYCGNSWCCKDL